MDRKSGYSCACKGNHHHRRSIRLRGYNYEQDGAYSITVCTQERICLFGDIVDDTMVLNDAGIMVEKWWNKIPRRYDAVEIDAFVIMPNHVHGIIIISKKRRRGETKTKKRAMSLLHRPEQRRIQPPLTRKPLGKTRGPLSWFYFALAMLELRRTGGVDPTSRKASSDNPL